MPERQLEAKTRGFCKVEVVEGFFLGIPIYPLVLQAADLRPPIFASGSEDLPPATGSNQPGWDGRNNVVT